MSLMPAKKSKAAAKVKEASSPAKVKKSAAPAAKKAPKTVTKTTGKVKAPTTKAVKPSFADPVPVVTQDQIATRAYYIGERRQRMGWPGDPSSDWIEAEAQLIAEAKRKKV